MKLKTDSEKNYSHHPSPCDGTEIEPRRIAAQLAESERGVGQGARGEVVVEAHQPPGVGGGEGQRITLNS